MAGSHFFMLLASTLSVCLVECIPEESPILQRVKNGNFEQGLYKASSSFAMEMYKAIAGLEDDHKNIFFSPISIYIALGMLKPGANGDTKKEIEDVMELSKSYAFRQGDMKRLLKRVFDPLSKNNSLSVANKLWIQELFCRSACKQYATGLQREFGAELQELDFEGETEKSREAINKWVESMTNNKIKDLMPEGSIDKLTRFVITNAIYFKGKWSTPFNKRFTRDSSFNAVTKSGLTSKKVPMMYVQASFRYSSDYSSPYETIDIPYESSGLSMTVIMPKDPNGLKKLEQSILTEPALTKVMKQMRRNSDVMLFLPKFEVSSDLDLKSSLAKMGMTRAFNRLRADLSGITGWRGLYVSKAVHKAFVNVDEEGSEAAAATDIGASFFSLPPSIRVNKPFIFLIRHQPTGTVLFMGRVVDPS